MKRSMIGITAEALIRKRVAAEKAKVRKNPMHDPLPVIVALVCGDAEDEKRLRTIIDARLAAAKAEGVKLPQIKAKK